MGNKILVIEDEKHIAEGLRLNLKMKGHTVEVANNGSEGLEIWRSFHPELIVLDLMMPILDGFKVLEVIRAEDRRLPILILSAKNESKDKVKCLAGGVDDYLSKPFNLDEFLLRVERLLERSSWAANEEVKDFKLESYEFGENHIDFVRARATCKGEVIQLTSQELKILKLFIQSEGTPLSRQTLLQAGWGYEEGMSTRTVDNFIVRFRKYFEVDPKNPIFFKSLRSIGYLFDAGSDK